MLSLSNYLNAGQTSISNLLLSNYHRIGLDTEECMFLLQIQMAQSLGEDFPDLGMIGLNMGIKSDKVYRLLDQLISKGCISIDTRTIDGKKADRYDLLPMYEKIDQAVKKQQQATQETTREGEIQQIYRSFEQEFGRPLSPIEFQRIAQWLEEDHYQPVLLELALREAVLNQAYSFNYIDRILLSWEKKNLTTKQQVEEEQKRRKKQLLQRETEQSGTKELPKVSLKNWLEE